MEALGPTLAPRVASADKLCVRWLETRTRLELDLLSHAVSIARGVVSEAFSSRTIAPGVTTTDDVAWYIRQRFTDLGLATWFVPTVERQFAGQACTANQPFCGASGVIERGDVLHCDVGITYLRLNTDTQEMGYVLRLGEEDAPPGLKKALAIGNRWQDLLTSSFATGRTGDEMFARTDAAAKQEGIVHSTYSHPVGFHGHAAGPAIGMWDNQGPVPVTGAWPLAPNTAYAIEGNIKAPVAEWNGGSVQIASSRPPSSTARASSMPRVARRRGIWCGRCSERRSAEAQGRRGAEAQSAEARREDVQQDTAPESGPPGYNRHQTTSFLRAGAAAGLGIDVRRRARARQRGSVRARDFRRDHRGHRTLDEGVEPAAAFVTF